MESKIAVDTLSGTSSYKMNSSRPNSPVFSMVSNTNGTDDFILFLGQSVHPDTGLYMPTNRAGAPSNSCIQSIP